MRVLKTICLSALLVVPSLGIAQSAGVQIGGDLDMKTKVKTQVAAAIGKNATAVNANNKISAGRIGGDVKMETAVKTQVAAAIGKGAKACNLNNVVGESNCTIGR